MRQKSFEKLLKEREHLLSNETRRRIDAICNLYAFREPFLERQNPSSGSLPENGSVLVHIGHNPINIRDRRR